MIILSAKSTEALCVCGGGEAFEIAHNWPFVEKREFLSSFEGARTNLPSLGRSGAGATWIQLR